ncbi:hypothetical protein [Paenibacillus sp. PAMC21692]|uniref:TolB family protein n=1 Tax=Paenibacillus sp. PAMC21692 TaxID=2762320 RepID=UPI00164D35F3|nr:hypothetical protein [Paenibacillus sp. PAMC21692]QNK55964.1 hypothetical protein H7F31_25790 [Paenibacillus sp. PAMC21692]
MLISEKFPRYTEYNPAVPVWCVTPGEGGGLHRFFDTSPVSPSGRYLAVIRMPYLDRINHAGEAADVVLIDLHTAEEQVIAQTYGWEYQLGANINWGSDDHSLYFNDVDTVSWEPHIICIDPLSGVKRRLEGSIYRISPDGSQIICANATTMRRTQAGYGVIVPEDRVPRNFGFVDDDGLYMTDTKSGKRRLVVSIRDIFDQAQPKIDKSLYEKGECYGFHCKFNPQGTRLIFTMRWYQTDEAQPWNQINKKLDFWVLTMKPDGSDIFVAVGPEQWRKGGHHINWFPDGEHLSMNLDIHEEGQVKLVQVRHDGKDLRMITDRMPGSGHPTVHPNGRHMVTDTYAWEPTAFGDGTIPIRWIDLQTQSEQTLIRINVDYPASSKDGSLRVDAHPAWTPDNRHIVFNGYVDGSRRVFLADLSCVLET